MKAKKPNNKIKPPKPANGTEWPGISIGFPSFVNLPRRGPIKYAATRVGIKLVE